MLHDADDKKYFPENKAYQNATKILAKVLKDQTEIDAKVVKKDTLETISYVSASDNGNAVPERAQAHPELLWVRYADRLEAIGAIGAVRCWQYNSEKGAELSVESTPRPATKEEVWTHVTPDRLANYMKNKTSASMMDHYYDKLLQIAVFDKKTVSNEWLCAEAERRVTPLLVVVLKFGKTGKPPVALIKKFAKSLGIETRPPRKTSEEYAIMDAARDKKRAEEKLAKEAKAAAGEVDKESIAEPETGLKKRKRKDSAQDEETTEPSKRRKSSVAIETEERGCQTQDLAALNKKFDEAAKPRV